MRPWATRVYLLKKVSKHSWPVMHCLSSVLHSPVGRQHLHILFLLFVFNFIPMQRIITCVCARAWERDYISRVRTYTYTLTHTHSLSFSITGVLLVVAFLSIFLVSHSTHNLSTYINLSTLKQETKQKTSKSQLGNLNEATGMQLVALPIIWQFCFISSLCSVKVS